MIVNLILAILLVFSLFFINYFRIKSLEIKEKNEQIERENKLIEQENKKQTEFQNFLINTNAEIQKEIALNEVKISEKQKMLDTLQKQLENNKQLSLDAFDIFADNLENKYINAEADLEKQLQELALRRHEGESAIIEIQEELDKIRATKAATMEALRKEKEIKAQSSFYCLQFSQAELNDMKKLNDFKVSLNQPRILSMLIWQTFVRDRLKAQTAKILNTTSVVCGIYKITNQETDECYIGQATDVAKRWTDHAKCGLGIDTPPGNELYKAMQDYGINSFSFELLEECAKAQLDEKERYYIELYDSYNFGYNKTKGNK